MPEHRGYELKGSLGRWEFVNHMGSFACELKLENAYIESGIVDSETAKALIGPSLFLQYWLVCSYINLVFARKYKYSQSLLMDVVNKVADHYDSYYDEVNGEKGKAPIKAKGLLLNYSVDYIQDLNALLKDNNPDDFSDFFTRLIAVKFADLVVQGNERLQEDSVKLIVYFDRLMKDGITYVLDTMKNVKKVKENA